MLIRQRINMLSSRKKLSKQRGTRKSWCGPPINGKESCEQLSGWKMKDEVSRNFWYKNQRSKGPKVDMFKGPNDPMPMSYELMHWSCIIMLIMHKLCIINEYDGHWNRFQYFKSNKHYHKMYYQVDLILQTRENGWNPFWIIQKVQKPNLG